MTDIELICAYRMWGDEQAFQVLLNKYGGLLNRVTQRYFIQGASYDDVWQEARIGFYKAVRDYKIGPAKFSTFADLCITRQVQTAVKMARARKHQSLNHGCSLDYLGDYEPMLVGPEEEDKDISMFAKLYPRLTPMEQTILVLKMEGYKFPDIAEKVGCSIKSVDNALQRIRMKAKRYLTFSDVPSYK